MNPSPRIALVGATGRTGNAVAHALAARSDCDLAACIAPSVAGTPTRSLPASVPAFAAVADVDVDVDVLVDLGVAEAVGAHLDLACSRGWHAVVGTTGLDEVMIERAGSAFAAAGLGLLIVPNFSLGAILMMDFARRASAYLPDAEIVEAHHETKQDAPSGTALRTAHLIAGARTARPAPRPAGASEDPALGRGMDVEGVRVHAVRLPGATAHQQVIFGGPGEVLTISHDAIDRACYAGGVALAARSVANCVGLKTGLEL